MKKLQLLKAFIDLFWFFSVFAILAMLFIIPFMFYNDDFLRDIPIKMNGEIFLILDLTTKIIMVFEIFAFGIFVFGIYKLRKTLSLFQKKIIFEIENIILLNQIGISFLLTSIVSSLPIFIYQIINKKFVLDFGIGFNSFLFSASLGLFFMVLSEVFKIAKINREENELTI